MSRYSPIDIVRKFVLRKCLEHLVITSEHAVWFNITFWENVTDKAEAEKCWQRLKKALVRENPDFRLVGIWARQRRGAWHVHSVCNQRFDIEWLSSVLVRSGFGPQFYVKEVDDDPLSPEKIARYISGYCTDKNGLDKEKDKGVRRMIFVGKNVRVVDMRYKSSLKRVTSIGRRIAEEILNEKMKGLTDFQRNFSPPEEKKKAFETWGEWYRRNRDYWFALGWESLSDKLREEMLLVDEFCARYLKTCRWSYV